MGEIWLQEPTESNESWAKSGEHTLDWLTISTHPRAKQMRLFLNHNLAKLPSSFSKELKNDLRNRWKTAFFELIVARILQEIGYLFKHEVPLAEGKRPDFLLETSIGEIVIEGTSPVFNSKVGDFYKKVNPLIKIIEKNAPDNWVININKLPDIGPNDSKKGFKRFIKKRFDNISNKNQKEEILISKEFPSGKLDILLIYRPDYTSSIGIRPLITYMENSKQRIQHAVKEKRKQVKKIDNPVILAIEGSNTGTDLEDFDQVLFGKTYERWDRNRKVVEKGLKPNGLLISENEDPTYQGILAFNEVGFKHLKAPTLYLHTNANPKLKKTFDAFYIRYYNESKNCIAELEPQTTINFQNFKFVTA